jgi:hypothetical protein
LAGIASVLATPSESTPPELIERLELLDLLCDPQSGVRLEDGYAELAERLVASDDSSEDLAVKVLLHAPQIAWREFDRQALSATRSLVSLIHPPHRKLDCPTPSRLTQLENLLRPWFERNARSGYCKVHAHEHSGGVSLVVRHGDMLKQVDVCADDGICQSMILRPERVDIAHYSRLTGEWQVSGVGRGLHELYRRAFGVVFHQSPAALTYSKRYSLEPLREGPDVLRCNFSARVRHATLASLKIGLPDGHHIVIKGPNVFKALAGLCPSILRTAPLAEAKINLKISGKRRVAPIILTPMRDRVSGLNADPSIAAWLTERGFCNRHSDEGLILESA